MVPTPLGPQTIEIWWPLGVAETAPVTVQSYTTSIHLGTVYMAASPGHTTCGPETKAEEEMMGT